ncbi:MAG: DEAD/DEAH box helicase family protein [Gammaproteobacteria bacterium]
MNSLRPYQQAAKEAVTQALASRPDNPCVVIPTGGGKTIIMAALIHEYVSTWPDTRICITAHTQELVKQNATQLARYWTDAPLGIYAAGLKCRDTQDNVIFGSIQSIYRRADELGHFDLVFIDEAHRIPLEGEGMYRRFMAAATAINPALRVVGWTATPYRMKDGRVCRADGILNHVCYEAKIPALIDDGYLTQLISIGGEAEPDLKKIRVRNGDFAKEELEAEMTQEGLIAAACRETVKRLHGRDAWLVFCCSIKHAEQISAELRRLGVTVDVVHSELSRKLRDDAITRFLAGETRALCNVNILSEGFDYPDIDAIVMLRPTLSPGLYYQQVGRGLRVADNKTNCKVLDFAKNVMTHGPIDAILPRARKNGEGKGEPPVKICPECRTFIPLSALMCPQCGYEYPERQPKHAREPDATPILSRWMQPQWLPVERVTYARHVGRKGTPTLRVEYHCGLSVHKEWVALEHKGYARKKAEQWWQARAYAWPCPRTIKRATALAATTLEQPTEILVDFNGKHSTIIGYRWPSNHEARARDALDDPGQAA